MGLARSRGPMEYCEVNLEPFFRELSISVLADETNIVG